MFTEMEASTYDLIRRRLNTQADELRQRMDALNQARKTTFGAVETRLIATDRITTSNNCIPRDMVAVGQHFLFGYNVHIGLRSELKLSDVFAVYRFDDDDHSFHEEKLDLLADPRFEEEFHNLYKYYKATVFAKFALIGPHLFMVFQVGKSARDVKTFKWAFTDDGLTYLGNRFDHEYRYPQQHEFTWQKVGREAHRRGVHPHVSIMDRVFVETIGGDLTVKVEDNTEDGRGIYSEPVDHLDQTLDDAEYAYADLGNLILLRIRPYQEKDYRYLIFNEKMQEALRVDALAQSCILLPDEQGIIFANGYYLQTGERKLFDQVPNGLQFERRIASSDGENFLYVFHEDHSGLYVLLPYNLVEMQVETPIFCGGFSIFPNGELVYFRPEDQPGRHHTLQIWQTPYGSNPPKLGEQGESWLAKVGNKDLVRGMAECNELLNLVNKDDSYANLYVDLVKKASDIVDSYYWIANAEAQNLAEPLKQIRETASSAIDEYEKVRRLKENTRESMQEAEVRVQELIDRMRRHKPKQVDEFVGYLGELRGLRGEIIGLRELRYVDEEKINGLEQSIAERSDAMSQSTVEFLLADEALKPYQAKVEATKGQIEAVQKVTEADEVATHIDQTGQQLELLIDVVSNLQIEDATQTTRIIDNVSAIFAQLNTLRSQLKARRRELSGSEAKAEFNAQLRLLSQSIINYLDLCDTPEKTEQYLTKLMVQVEELEGKFSEFDEFVGQLSEKREEVYNAFETRRVQLLEKRQQRAITLMNSAERILKGIQNRAGKFEEVNEINGYFAADLMVNKVRDIVEELNTLGDPVKAGDLQSRLKTLREEAIRQLKDRSELFVGGDNVIKFGRHHFSVNQQDLDLSIVQRDGDQYLHLTGTNFFEKIDDPAFLATRPVWNMSVVSESDQVYRGEYLAYVMLSSPPLEGAEGRTLTLDDVQSFMSTRYTEGYIKGIHDHDAALILQQLQELQQGMDLLRYSPEARACAQVFWAGFIGETEKNLFNIRLKGAGVILQAFPNTHEFDDVIDDLAEQMHVFLQMHRLFPEEVAGEAAEYLFYELTQDDHFVISGAAGELYKSFTQHLKHHRLTAKFNKSVEELTDAPEERFELIRHWVRAYNGTQVGATGSSPKTIGANRNSPKTIGANRNSPKTIGANRNSPKTIGANRNSPKTIGATGNSPKTIGATGSSPKTIGATGSSPKTIGATGNSPKTIGANRNSPLLETAAILFANSYSVKRTLAVDLTRQIDGMAGEHSAVGEGGVYELDYHAFMRKLRHHVQQVVPQFEAYQKLKHELVEKSRVRLRLEEFRPKVMSAFVRNQLIDKVYLPLIGDNLAKQLGTVGENTRTDRQGLLLLISPPGYGKTTLMEYIANRLGLIFMKINGPAIGHHVTSLDPSEAPNAAAREELAKLNLSLEMGDNVMLYLDDIQHCNPEFLQKFISLTDAQRKIEGVYQGQTRTYDLRGRKVAVVMAGNPYTESGEKFRIPDMLSNRADTYNLGDIIGDSADHFKLSYLENALTANPVLNRLASQSQRDIRAIIRVAETGQQEGLDFEGNISSEEMEEYLAVLRKLLVVRDVILRVNQQYIASAGQQDEYRTEPPFLLQGSYRNMARLAEKVMPIMNDEELHTLILSHYEGESQTLTTGAEANLLKFKQLNDYAANGDAQRWDEICRIYREQKMLSADRMAQLVKEMGSFSEGLMAIKEVLERGSGE